MAPAPTIYYGGEFLPEGGRPLAFFPSSCSGERARGAATDFRLVAYLVAASETPLAARELRRFLAAQLPEHMIPSAFVPLAALPLTVHGKVDRRALPEPDAAFAGGADFVAPRSPAEEAIAAIWLEVLGRDRIGVTDHYLLLGGLGLRDADLHPAEETCRTASWMPCWPR